MARNWKHFATLGHGERAVVVGYSPTERNGVFGVRFVDPSGKRLEKMTPCEKIDGRYHVEVMKILNDAYTVQCPDPQKITFDAALAEVARTASDLRPATLESYVKATRVLVNTLAQDRLLKRTIVSPLEITEELANRFSVLWLSSPYKRGSASDATVYKRKPTTLCHYLRTFRGLWKRFRKLGYIRENPWKDVEDPKTDKIRKPVPTEEQVTHFWSWVTNRYPTWERLHALLDLKAVSGCRTLDICQLRTDQLKDGRVNWDASQVKTREARSVLLPTDLYHRLQKVAGRFHLWDSFMDDIRRYRPSRNVIPQEFQASTVYAVVANIFREYSDSHPDRPRMTPHALRRRAITLTVMATGGNVDAAAQAIGVNPQTARAYYLDSERAFQTDETFRKVAEVLLPKAGQGK